MKRRISSLFAILACAFTLASCSIFSRQTLLFLNWGEYVDETLLEEFEKEYNCTVSMDLGDSNEIFYSKISSGTTIYDVVCPSEYMVEKLYQNDMLREIDHTIVTSYEYDELMPGVKSIIDGMKERNDDNIVNYFTPYLWGTWGIMYSTRKEGLKEAVLTNENQWSCLFDRNTIPSGTRVAMYDSHQHAYYAVTKYLAHCMDLTPIDDPDYINSHDMYDKNSNQMMLIGNTVKNMNFDKWGTDKIKKDIVLGNCDLGFMWTGDFLYFYAEECALRVTDALEANDITKEEIPAMVAKLTDSNDPYYKCSNGKVYSIGFDLFIPDDTIAFCDNLVIPKDSAHYELANKFINFMSQHSTENTFDEEYDETMVQASYYNTYYVDYNAVFTPVYNQLVGLKDDDTVFADSDDGEIGDLVYDYVIGIAFDKYYNSSMIKGDPLSVFPRTYIDRINTVFNNARA